MIRIVVAIVISLTLALPGAFAATSGHSDHDGQSAAAHQHVSMPMSHGHSDEAPHDSSALTCCLVLAGHCGSVGLISDQEWVRNALTFDGRATRPGRSTLSIANTFEADPPPPRV